MNHKTIPNFFINAFYENKFRDNFFVVKAGGKIVEDQEALDSLIANIRDLTQIGIKVLLIYGGGRAIDRRAAELGVQVVKHEGRRVTDQATIDIVKEVVGGSLALNVYQSMARNKLEGLSLNAIPAEWMRVELRSQPIDFGFVGDIKAVFHRPVNRLFKSTNFIACACLASTEDGTVCNINADTIATQLAIGTKASKLVFLSDIDGVKLKGAVAPLITAEEIPMYIHNGQVKGGMQVKLENCAEALKAGVRRIHLINGLRKDALKKEIFEPVGPGTMLIKASEEQSYKNEIEAQKLLESRK